MSGSKGKIAGEKKGSESVRQKKKHGAAEGVKDGYKGGRDKRNKREEKDGSRRGG